MNLIKVFWSVNPLAYGSHAHVALARRGKAAAPLVSRSSRACHTRLSTAGQRASEGASSRALVSALRRDMHVMRNNEASLRHAMQQCSTAHRHIVASQHFAFAKASKKSAGKKAADAKSDTKAKQDKAEPQTA